MLYTQNPEDNGSFRNLFTSLDSFVSSQTISDTKGDSQGTRTIYDLRNINPAYSN